MSTPPQIRPAARRTFGLVALIALVGFLGISLSACAQTSAPTSASRPAGSDRMERQLTEMRAAVDLTDAQVTRIRAVLAANRPAGGRGQGAGRRDDGRQGRGRPTGDRSAMAERRAESERQIEAVLTPAQVERYRAWRATQRSQRRGGPGRDGGRNGDS